MFWILIHGKGILASKMRKFLNSDLALPKGNEKHQIIKKCFMETEDCIWPGNVPNLRHIVDFLTDLIASNRLGFSKSLEEGVDALNNRFLDAKNISELNNIVTPELIELYQYQTNMSTNREQD